MSTKFDEIKFPFFGLKNKPFKISFYNSSVTLTKFKYGKVYILDDVSLLGKNYSERLLELDTIHPNSYNI